MPGDDFVEAAVELGAGIHGVQADGVAPVAELPLCVVAEMRVEVVEAALRHEEVRRAHAELVLDARHLERGLERQVDVVPEIEVARARMPVEARPLVAAGAGGVEQLAVVRQIERASTHWNVASPSGSRNVTSSSRTISKSASRTSREFTAAG